MNTPWKDGLEKCAGAEVSNDIEESNVTVEEDLSSSDNVDPVRFFQCTWKLIFKLREDLFASNYLFVP